MQNTELLYSAKPSASVARNIGIDFSERRIYCIYSYDDDYISNNFLEEMYNNADVDTIVVSQIVNIDENGDFDSENTINTK